MNIAREVETEARNEGSDAPLSCCAFAKDLVKLEDTGNGATAEGEALGTTITETRHGLRTERVILYIWLAETF
jgi:hypothetical protein